MLFVIEYGCERIIEDGLRLFESDAMFLAIRGRFLFIPYEWFGHRRDCFLWTNPCSIYSTATRDSKRRHP
jgi:hypothetical protein